MADAEADAAAEAEADADADAAPAAPAILPITIASAPLCPARAPTSSTAPHAHAEEVQALAVALVERAAVWGDGERGVARLRLGSRAKGELAHATVLLEHDGERLRLRVDGGSCELADHLRERLRARGLPVADD